MFHELVYTTDDLVLMVLRLTLGVIFLVHGAQKSFGWFGGFGYKQTMAAFTGQLGIPAPLALLTIVAEFFGGLGLITECSRRCRHSNAAGRQGPHLASRAV